jgi:hypothetical protein
VRLTSTPRAIAPEVRAEDRQADIGPRIVHVPATECGVRAVALGEAIGAGADRSRTSLVTSAASDLRRVTNGLLRMRGHLNESVELRDDEALAIGISRLIVGASCLARQEIFAAELIHALEKGVGVSVREQALRA